MHQRCSHRFSRESTIAVSKHINDEERFFVRLLILVLALLFCPSQVEEELRDVKQKIRRRGSSILCVMKGFTIKKKAIPFRQKTHTQVPLSRSWFSYPQRERHFPFGPVVGEEGFEPPTPWFVATCSNPLSYRPHPVSTGSVPGSTLKKGTFPLPSRFGLRRCESAFLSIRTERCVPRCEVGEEGCHNWGFE